MPDGAAVTDDVFRALGHDLAAAGFKGDFDGSWSVRMSAATDNSVYQIPPDAVAYPKDVADVRLLVELLNRDAYRHLSVTGRGASTGTNGQSLNKGLIVDFRRHMDRVIAVDPDGNWVDVQPGIALDAVNAAIGATKRFFPPHTSTSNRCTIGGMISTDACGQGSRIFGKTSDNLFEVDVITSTGVELTLRRCEVRDGHPLDNGSAARDALFESLIRVCDDGREALVESVPALSRHFVGYDIIRARPSEDTFDPTRLIAGSEGTLAIITRARLKLHPKPARHHLVVIAYESFEAALASARQLIAFDPEAVETLDDRVLSAADASGLLDGVDGFFQKLLAHKGFAVNYVEFSGEDPDKLAGQAEGLLKAMTGAEGVLDCLGTCDAEAMRKLWDVRKLSVGLLASAPSARRPIAFMEDCVVPPENLSAFAADLRDVLDGHGLEYGMFGHVDVGCLHVRPALNVSDPTDRGLVKQVSDQVQALVRKHGGLFWGEHGKGVRGEYLADTVGAKAYATFADVKRAFDPGNRLNPGKLVNPDADVSALYSIAGTPFREMVPEDGSEDFEDAYRCNGNAHCQSLIAKTPMCPSFRARKDVRHSPKGRSDLLRAWNAHRVGSGPAVAGDEVKEALDGCLGCKACASDCPVHVDIPEMKSRFLEAYHAEHRRPLADHLVANVEAMGALLHRTPGLANALMAASSVVLRGLGLIDLPAFRPARAGGNGTGGQSVYVIADAFTRYFDGAAVEAVVDGLTALGYAPRVAGVAAFGKPLHVLGFRRRFMDVAARAKAALDALDADVPQVAVDPTTALLLRQEYDEAGVAPARRVMLVQEFLAAEVDRGAHASWPKAAAPAVKPAVMLHCTERTAVSSAGAMWRKVFGALGIEVDVPDAGCCGMAGVFGHRAENQPVSRWLWENGWAQVVAREDRNVVASGFSCRCQAGRFGSEKARHPMSIVTGG